MWGLDVLIFVSVSLVRENLRIEKKFITQNPNLRRLSGRWWFWPPFKEWRIIPLTRPEPEMWPLTRLGTMTPEASEAILPDKLDSAY